MNPGKLDRALVLLRRTVTNDDAGSPVETWLTDPLPLWAERIEARGTEPTTSGSTRSLVTSTYRIRYRSDLAAADAAGKFRIRADGRDHDLVAALEDEKAPRRSALLLSLAYTQGEATLTSVPTV